jgi:hypothetical protein
MTQLPASARGQHGSALVLVLAVVVVAVVLVHAVARVAVASHARVRARTGADAAALAGADTLALGQACGQARVDASRLAAANDTVLVGFSCDGSEVTAVVAVQVGDPWIGTVRATARAEVDVSCMVERCR